MSLQHRRWQESLPAQLICNYFQRLTGTHDVITAAYEAAVNEIIGERRCFDAICLIAAKMRTRHHTDAEIRTIAERASGLTEAELDALPTEGEHG